MTAASDFLRLSACLGRRPVEPVIPPERGRLVDLANEHLVSPALWRRWAAENDSADTPPTPEDDYLAALYDMNAERNRLIRAHAVAAARALNGAGIVPAVLKGAAFLFDGRRPIGWRIMSDLDLAVPPEAARVARAVLVAEGWRAEAETDAGPDSPRVHATVLTHDDVPVTLDLHQSVGPQRTIITVADLLAAGETITAGEARLILPSPTHRVLHNVLNAEVFGPNHLGGVLALRQLLDLAALAEDHPPAPPVDWAVLDRVMARAGHRAAFRAWVHAAVALLDMPPPPGVPAGAAARLHLRRCLMQMDRPTLGRAAMLVATVLHPFEPARLRFLYPEHAGGAGRLLLRHAGAIWRRHGLHVITRIGRQGGIR